jgi:hypothetical protein
MKRLGIAAALIIFTAVGLLFVIAVRTPGREDRLASFVGPGEILESVGGRNGSDRYYWARYRCDPDSVRLFIQRHTHPSRENGNQRLDGYYLNPSFKWPANMEIFQADWIEFTTSPGTYVVIAFPSDETQEILFFEHDF